MNFIQRFCFTFTYIEKQGIAMKHAPRPRRKQDDLNRIVSSISSAAKLYQQFLVGRKFLYAFDGRFIEVIYKAQNFRHLTGVETSLSAKRFYQAAVHDQLQTSQIHFSKTHPYDLCLRKVKHLHEIATLAASESFLLEEIRTNTQSYKFGTTDLNFTLCMNQELDTAGKAISECFVVQSLRDEDCFQRAKNVYPVTHILSKPNDAHYYTDIVYLEQGESLSTLPVPIQSMISNPEEL